MGILGKKVEPKPSPMGGILVRPDSPYFFPFEVNERGEVIGDAPPIVKHDRNGKVVNGGKKSSK